MADRSSFPSRLTTMRKRYGLSQLALALAAGCSQRHLSFLELGRTRPSREMVQRLSMALALSLRQSNEMLLAAGFAPVWAESDLNGNAMQPVRAALHHILSQQEPYPAVVVDRRWNLLQANKGAAAMVTHLVGSLSPGATINLADALVAPDVLRPHLQNWEEVAAHFVRSVETDAAADGTKDTRALLERLLGYSGVKQALSAAPQLGVSGPVLPMRFRKRGIELNLFTTIATLGTPQDITLQELRIESFFPVDDATRCQFEQWRNEQSSG
jgi:transcriptional regulator with XRE-family HTH domain